MKSNLFGINKSTNKQTVTSLEVDEFFERIKTDSCDGHILRYRDIYAQVTVSHGRYVHRDDIKDVCVSAKYYRKRSGEREFRCYNGVVVLEIDSLSNKVEMDNVKHQASLIPQTLAAFEGCDGHLVIILALATLPNNELPKAEEQILLFHTEAYRVAVLCYSPTIMHQITIKEPKIDATFMMTVVFIITQRIKE